MINGNTKIIAHPGFSPHAFKAPMIYSRVFNIRKCRRLVSNRTMWGENRG